MDLGAAEVVADQDQEVVDSEAGVLAEVEVVGLAAVEVSEEVVVWQKLILNSF